MKNWMLVCCCERCIEEPTSYRTYEEAYNEMRYQFALMMDWKLNEVDEMLAESDSSCGIDNNSAWGEHGGITVDWKIFSLIDII